MGAAGFALRAAGAVAARRPTTWVLFVLWVVALWSSAPFGLTDGDAVLGHWYSLALTTPPQFAAQLTVLHLVWVVDVQLALRAAGVGLFAVAAVGGRQWALATAAVAFGGALLHVLVWAGLIAIRCLGTTGRIDGSLATDAAARLPGDVSGIVSTAAYLFAAVLTLATVSMVVAALVHMIASTVVVTTIVALWCVAEIPVGYGELSRGLAVVVDPAVMVSPYALLVGGGVPLAGMPGLVCVWAAAWAVVVAARRHPALVAGG